MVLPFPHMLIPSYSSSPPPFHFLLSLHLPSLSSSFPSILFPFFNFPFVFPSLRRQSDPHNSPIFIFSSAPYPFPSNYLSPGSFFTLPIYSLHVSLQAKIQAFEEIIIMEN